MSFLNPNVTADSELAEEFESYLKVALPWEEDSFGGEYAWSGPIPPKEDWESEVDDLIAMLIDVWGDPNAEKDEDAWVNPYPTTVSQYCRRYGLSTTNTANLNDVVIRVTEECDHCKIWIADGFYVRAVCADYD